MNSLEVTDAESKAVVKSPNTRVALADIEAAIKAEYTSTAHALAGGFPVCDELKILTLHLVVMKNGFVVVGKSAPADPQNFNAELGAKFAREDAIRQLWPLMGYALRDKLVNS